MSLVDGYLNYRPTGYLPNELQCHIPEERVQIFAVRKPEVLQKKDFVLEGRRMVLITDVS